MRLVVSLAVCVAVSAALRLRDPVAIQHERNTRQGVSSIDAAAANIIQYATEWYDRTRLDHFTFNGDGIDGSSNGSASRFKMRYLANMTYYKEGGPIFFYSGNEGGIEGFAEATGMMWDLAPKFNAALIFAEHRFYGKTQPFGKNSYDTVKQMGYLTSTQALADYAQFLTDVKTGQWPILGHSFNTTVPKIITFGGSYGGMLSAWFRLKYPHVVDGAWASSAPLLYFNSHPRVVDWGAFDATTTKTFTDAGANFDAVQKGWNAILNLSANADGCAFLNKLFNIDPKSLIKTPTDGAYLVDFVREAIEYMAMVDYPFPTAFLTPMNGFPAAEAGKILGQINGTASSWTDKQLATLLKQAADVYYNSTSALNTNPPQTYCVNPTVCGDPATAALGDPFGWPWQECSEIIVEMCARGNKSDFFWNECTDHPIDVLTATCKEMFNGTGQFNKGWTMDYFRPNAVPYEYGLNMLGASRIILTQGALDPWSAGGYQAGSDRIKAHSEVFAQAIAGSAHHLDLRTPNTCDPDTVKQARFQITNIIACWIDAKCAESTWTPLKTTFKQETTTNCTAVWGGYPWGQESTSSASTLFSLTAIVAVAAFFF